MRSWQLQELGDPIDQLKFVDNVEPPKPKPDQVVVDVEAVGLAFPDVLQCQGKYQIKVGPGHTPGGEFAGTVSALGTEVDSASIGIDVGTRVVVLGSGGLSERVVANSSTTFPIPDGVDVATAAALPINYCTTHHALYDRAELKTGDTMLVTGAAGGTGTSAIQLGKHIGARIIAVVGSDEKAQVVRDLGADEVIDHRQIPDWVDTVREMSGGGVDVAYDPVGGDTFHQVRRCMAWNGRLLVIGFVAGIPELATNHVLLKSYQVVGVHWGAATARFDGLLKREMTELLDLAAKGIVAPPMFPPYSFDQAAQALQDINDRKVHSKVIVKL